MRANATTLAHAHHQVAKHSGTTAQHLELQICQTSMTRYWTPIGRLSLHAFWCADYSHSRFLAAERLQSCAEAACNFVAQRQLKASN